MEENLCIDKSGVYPGQLALGKYVFNAAEYIFDFFGGYRLTCEIDVYLLRFSWGILIVQPWPW